ncbi:hypothetical protein Btru_034726 [Bulinus truncatus]|nr:hypothetical protein Btru_034726 [Bulinus truncatus]
MEFFGFSSASTNMDAGFSAFPEAILKSYNPDINTLTPVMNSPIPDAEGTIIQLPDLSQLFAMSNFKVFGTEVGMVLQNLLDEFVRLSEKPLVRHVVAGIMAAALVYGVWRVNACWNEDFDIDLCSVSDINTDLLSRGSPNIRRQPIAQPKKNKAPGNLQVACRKRPPKERTEIIGDNKLPDYLPKEEEPKTRSTTAVAYTNTEAPVHENISVETIISSTEQFQRQLTEALGKLDEVRLKLVELENDKNLLTAEIELRKKIILRLQNENTSERDRRQHAELKMEMMEIENNQLRQLRKELLLKASQVDRLEKFLREKEEQQDRLFAENVVLPRSVAQVRAKEFGDLQNRLEKLESELCLAGTNANSRSQVPPNEGPAIDGTRDSNYCSHATSASVVKKKCKDDGESQNSDPQSSSSRTLDTFSLRENSVSNHSPVHNDTSEREQSQAILSETSRECACSEVSHSTRAHGGKGVIAQLRALLTGTSGGGSSTESDVEEIHRDEERNQPSDGQSSVFMSASCGSDSSENEVTVISTKALGKKLSYRKNFGRRVTRCKRKKLCERDVNVSKCEREDRDQQPQEDGSAPTITSNDEMSNSCPIASQATSCSPSRSQLSIDSSLKESKENQENSSTGSSEARGTESEESWIVIMPTVG